MGKIKNKSSYPVKVTPITEDYLIGSDSEDGGKTVNFSVGNIIKTGNFLTKGGYEGTAQQLKDSIPTSTSEIENDGATGNSVYVEEEELSEVAFSGSYNDLTNKPTIELNTNNFVRVLEVTENLLSGVGTIEEQICEYILALPEEERTIAETDSKWNIVTVIVSYEVIQITSSNVV